MSAIANTFMRRFVEFINKADETLGNELIANDAIFHVPNQSLHFSFWSKRPREKRSLGVSDGRSRPISTARRYLSNLDAANVSGPPAERESVNRWAPDGTGQFSRGRLESLGLPERRARIPGLTADT